MAGGNILDVDGLAAQYDAQNQAYAKQAAVVAQARQAQEQQAKQPPSLLERFAAPIGHATISALDSVVSEAEQWGTAAKRVGQDVASGAVTGATNIADAAGSALTTSGRGLAMAEDPAHADAAQAGVFPTSPIWDHAKSAILDFRDAIAVKDPNLVDSLTQGIAQLAIPFAGYSRALSGLHGIANIAAAGAATDATALGPHDMRMADLISLGRHTEGKLGEVLRKLTPDGSAVNAYISYLTDRGNESEAEGRFKNVLDGFGVNMIATPLIAAAGTVLKQGAAGLRYAAENDIRNIVSDLVPAGPPAGSKAAQRGSVGVQNNASGESAASLEAQSFARANKNAGIIHYRLDEEGKPTILPGIEARDPKPITGQPVVQLNAQGEHEIIDRGNLTKQAVEGLIVRSRELHGLGKFAKEKPGA